MKNGALNSSHSLYFAENSDVNAFSDKVVYVMDWHAATTVLKTGAIIYSLDRYTYDSHNI